MQASSHTSLIYSLRRIYEGGQARGFVIPRTSRPSQHACEKHKTAAARPESSALASQHVLRIATLSRKPSAPTTMNMAAADAEQQHSADSAASQIGPKAPTLKAGDAQLVLYEHQKELLLKTATALATAAAVACASKLAGSTPAALLKGAHSTASQSNLLNHQQVHDAEDNRTAVASNGRVHLDAAIRPDLTEPERAATGAPEQPTVSQKPSAGRRKPASAYDNVVGVEQTAEEPQLRLHTISTPHSGPEPPSAAGGGSSAEARQRVPRGLNLQQAPTAAEAAHTQESAGMLHKLQQHITDQLQTDRQESMSTEVAALQREVTQLKAQCKALLVATSAAAAFTPSTQVAMPSMASTVAAHQQPQALEFRLSHQLNAAQAEVDQLHGLIKAAETKNAALLREEQQLQHAFSVVFNRLVALVKDVQHLELQSKAAADRHAAVEVLQLFGPLVTAEEEAKQLLDDTVTIDKRLADIKDEVVRVQEGSAAALQRLANVEEQAQQLEAIVALQQLIAGRQFSHDS